MCSGGEEKLIKISELAKICGLPKLSFRLMAGSLHKSELVHCYKGKNIRIIRKNEGPAHADGDWFLTSNTLEIRIIPSALNVII